MRGMITQLCWAVSLAGMAEAAPWTREEGGWYARALAARDTLNGAEGWRTDVYGEYGLTNRLTLTAKAESVAYDGFAAFDQDTYRLTLRRQLLTAGNWTLGAELGALHTSTELSFTTCAGSGGEARTGLGYSGERKGRKFYAFGDAAYIRQEDGCERRRIELGYGSDLTDRIFLTQQVWLEDGTRSADSIKTESQFGVHFRRFDLALGYRDEIGGQFDETAVLVTLTARR